MPDSVIEDIIDRARGRIDDIDKEIIELLKQRKNESALIRRRKRQINKPDIDLARENEIIKRYRDGLGQCGTEVVGAVLLYSKDIPG